MLRLNFMLIAPLALMTSCSTFNFSMAHSAGATTQDENASNTPTTTNSATIPFTSIPQGNPLKR